MEWVTEKLYVPALTFFLLFHKYRHHGLIRCLSNLLDGVDLSWCDLYQYELSWNCFNSEYRIFVPTLIKFGIIFALSIFKTLVASKVFTFNFHCAIPRHYLVGKIRLPDDQVQYVAVVCSVRIWNRGQDGSLRVHPSAVINILS